MALLKILSDSKVILSSSTKIKVANSNNNTPTATPTYGLKFIEQNTGLVITEINEDSSFQIHLETTNVPVNTEIPFTITGVSETDIINLQSNNVNPLTGSFIANWFGSGIGAVDLGIVADVLTEGPETMIVTLDGITPTVSAALVINDTSTALPLLTGTAPTVEQVVIDGTTTNAWSFDGTNQLQTTPKNNLNFGLQPFTIEFWVNPLDINVSDQVIFQEYADIGTLEYSYFTIILAQAGNAIAVFDPTSNPVVYDYRSISDSAWTHCAFVRYADLSTKVFINGEGVEKQPVTYNFNREDYVPVIGAPVTTDAQVFQQYAFRGKLANFKITTGTSVYTSNFTPSVIVESPSVP